MKRNINKIISGLIFSLSLIILLIGLQSCGEGQKSYNDNPKDTLPTPTKLIDKFSYMVGNTMGQNFERDSLYNVNYDYLILGIKDVLAKKVRMSKTEFDSLNETMSKMLYQRQKNKSMRDRKAAEDAKNESYQFLAKNKLNKDVITLPSGLQYKIIKNGTGSTPKPGDYVKINAVATALNGREINNSYKEKKPIMAQLKEGMLLSWLQSIPLMKKGSKWILYSPSELAFGERGMSDIPGNKVIIFEIELLDFQVEPFPNMPLQ